MILFYDFEVFKYYWCVVIIDPSNRKRYVIETRKDLTTFYENHKDWIWCGYNSKGFDQFILKGIILGYNPYKVMNWIIQQGQSGWFFSKDMKDVPLIDYDVIVKRAGNYVGLKNLEYHMGESIVECSVPFDLDRPLTDKEKQEVIYYCTNDVEATIKTFLIEKKSFDAKLGLIKMYKLPLRNINKTNAQLTAVVLGAKQPKNFRHDEFDLFLPKCLKLHKYQYIADWYLNKENHDYLNSLVTNVWGIEHTYGWGGFHAAKANIDVSGIIVDSDIASLYPATMILFGLLSRNIPDELKGLYKEIRDNRIKLKKEKNPLQEALKLILNTTYGILKDVNNPMYDPLMSNEVCIHGMLLMTMLIEMLEDRFGDSIELLQSNTDGIFVKLQSMDQFEQYKEVCNEWCKITGYDMEHDIYKRYIAKDVNNYIAIKEDGSLHRKGVYVKELGKNDYELGIVNKALVDYLTKDIPIETTINNCTSLKEFQMVAKLGPTYDHLLHGNEVLEHKYYRIFASKNKNDGGMYKAKSNGKKDKIANTPANCFIDNSNVNSKRVPRNLDKQYYIDLAWKRAIQFLGRDPRQLRLW